MLTTSTKSWCPCARAAQSAGFGAELAARKANHDVTDLANGGQHGLIEQRLRLRLARREPLVVVVAGQGAQERQGFGAEVGENGRGGFHFDRPRKRRAISGTVLISFGTLEFIETAAVFALAFLNDITR